MSCQAPGLFITPSSTHTSDVEATEEASSEVDLDDIYNKLEEMKQRALFLRRSICLDDAPSMEEPKLSKASLSKNKDIQKLQQENATLYCHITENIQQLRMHNNQLIEFEGCLQQQRDKLISMDTKMTGVEKWKADTQRLAGLCLERFSDINMTCCSTSQFDKYLRRLATEFDHASKCKVPDVCFRSDQRRIVQRLANSKEMVRASAHLLLNHTNQLNRVVANGKSDPKKAQSSRSSLQCGFFAMMHKFRQAESEAKEKKTTAKQTATLNFKQYD